MGDKYPSRSTKFAVKTWGHLRTTFSLIVMVDTLSESFFANSLANLREILKMKFENFEI